MAVRRKWSPRRGWGCLLCRSEHLSAWALRLPIGCPGSSRFASCVAGGSARIGYLVGLHPSTVHRVFTRYRLAKLQWLDHPSGCAISRINSVAPGGLVHVDVKKVGKIPAGGDGGCWAARYGWESAGGCGTGVNCDRPCRPGPGRGSVTTNAELW